MLFRLLGWLVQRAWIAVLLGWGLLFLGTRYAAPAWNEVVQDKEFAFLPKDAPSLRAEEMYNKAFPGDKLSSNIVLVVSDSELGRLARDLAFLQDVVYPRLQQIADQDGGMAD